MLLFPSNLDTFATSSTSSGVATAAAVAMEAATQSKRKRSHKPKTPKPPRFKQVEEHDIEDFSSKETLQIRSSLLHWYDANHRILPWRVTASSRQREAVADEERAYAVWVSEVMLQQTRVRSVIEYYNRWMAKWPTLRLLAAASQEEVNEMWAGLGYYRRARFLLEGARLIVKEGEFPQTASALRGVRGIGEYTAGAIASIAFNEVVPVVDGNVVRVISRLKVISANPKEAATMKRFWKLAKQLVDPDRPGDFNQAIMELGATLCSKSSPDCSACPVSDHCRAFLLSGDSETVKVTDYPLKVAKAKQRHEFSAVCVLEIKEGRDQELLEASKDRHIYVLVKRPEEGLLGGLWEFPSVLIDEEKTNRSTRRRAMDNYINELFDLDVRRDCNVMLREDVGEYVHVFSHIRLHMFVELMVVTFKGGLNLLAHEEKSSTTTWKCVDSDSIKDIGLTSGVRKVCNMVQDFKKNSCQNITRVAMRKARKIGISSLVIK